VQFLLVHSEQPHRSPLPAHLVLSQSGHAHHLLRHLALVRLRLRLLLHARLFLADHLLQAARADAILEAMVRHLLRKERTCADGALRRVVEDHLLVLTPRCRRQSLLRRLEV